MSKLNRKVLRSRTISRQKLCIKHEDVHNNEKMSTFSYPVKFEDSKIWFSLSTRAFGCEIQLHSLWKYHLLLQLEKSGCFRFKFFCFIIALLQKTEGTTAFIAGLLALTMQPCL